MKSRTLMGFVTFLAVGLFVSQSGFAQQRRSSIPFCNEEGGGPGAVLSGAQFIRKYVSPVSNSNMGSGRRVVSSTHFESFTNQCVPIYSVGNNRCSDPRGSYPGRNTAASCRPVHQQNYASFAGARSSSRPTGVARHSQAVRPSRSPAGQLNDAEYRQLIQGLDADIDLNNLPN